MSKVGSDIIKGAREALAYARGERVEGIVVHVPEEVDVRAIRRRTGLSQAAFAARYGFTKSAVQDWEQGRRKPERAARLFLKVLDREPEAVERALTAA